MKRIDRLFVMWAEPAQGRRTVIGHLRRETDGEFTFSYDESGLREAQARGFVLLSEFPLAQTYRSRYLFSTFAQRIPSPKRPDYRAMLDAWGVSGDDQLELLAVSGGIQHTDSLELAEYRAADDPLDAPVRMRIAAEKHFPAAAQLKPGDELELQRDLSNPSDPLATWFVLREGERVGYVPRQYTALIAKHLLSGSWLGASVLRRLPVPLDRGRWLVQVSKRSSRH